MLQVDIIDHSPVYREGLTCVLLRHGIEVRHAGDDAVAADGVDVVVCGASALEEPGRAARAPGAYDGCRVLVITDAAAQDMHEQERLRRLGARGSIGRDASVNACVVAIRVLAAGGEYWDGGENIDESMLDLPVVRLSRREQQVLTHIAGGSTHDQIARRLGISPHTVHTYVQRIRAKLGPANKAELTRMALLGVGSGAGVLAA